MRSEVRVLPELFLSRLRKIIPSQKWDSIANTFSQPKPTTFRVNTLKSSAQTIREALEKLGLRLQSVPWYRDAFILRQGRLRELEKADVYQRGEIYVQGLSSMLPVLVLDPKPGEHILDLTAAPGSKTTQMSCLMKGEGRIVAIDSDRIRFAKLKANVALQGANNVELLLSYGESIGKKFPGQFDRVLLDVPCSGEGRFETRGPATYRYWTVRKVNEAAQTQKKLLSSAFLALKPGGVLVYSTCTFAPEENEGVVSDLAERFESQIELVVGPIHELPLCSIPNQMRGLMRWERRDFHPSLKKAVRILPTSEMEGFFIARIRKKGKLP